MEQCRLGIVGPLPYIIGNQSVTGVLFRQFEVLRNVFIINALPIRVRVNLSVAYRLYFELWHVPRIDGVRTQHERGAFPLRVVSVEVVRTVHTATRTDEQGPFDCRTVEAVTLALLGRGQPRAFGNVQLVGATHRITDGRAALYLVFVYHTQIYGFLA